MDRTRPPGVHNNYYYTLPADFVQRDSMYDSMHDDSLHDDKAAVFAVHFPA